MLKPLAESEFAAGLNYMDWYTSIRELWDRASRKTKKTKDIVVCDTSVGGRNKTKKKTYLYVNLSLLPFHRSHTP